MKKIVLPFLLLFALLGCNSHNNLDDDYSQSKYTYIYENATDVPIYFEWYAKDSILNASIAVGDSYKFIEGREDANSLNIVLHSDSARMVFGGEKELWFYRKMKQVGAFGYVSEDSGAVYLFENYVTTQFSDRSAEYKFIIDKSLYDRAVEIAE